MDYTITLPYLSAWRKAAGLSLADLAHYAHTTASTVSRAEHGAGVQLGTASKLARALGVENRDLVSTPPDGRVLVGWRALPVTEDADGLWYQLDGRHLRMMRQDKAMSKWLLATRAGLPTATIRALESDAVLLPARELEALAVALEVGQLELLCGYVPRSQRITRPAVEPLRVHPRLRRRWLLGWAALADADHYPAAGRRYRREIARLTAEIDAQAAARAAAQAECRAYEDEMRRVLASRVAWLATMRAARRAAEREAVAVA